MLSGGGLTTWSSMLGQLSSDLPETRSLEDCSKTEVKQNVMETQQEIWQTFESQSAKFELASLGRVQEITRLVNSIQQSEPCRWRFDCSGLLLMYTLVFPTELFLLWEKSYLALPVFLYTCSSTQEIIRDEVVGSFYWDNKGEVQTFRKRLSENLTESGL